MSCISGQIKRFNIEVTLKYVHVMQFLLKIVDKANMLLNDGFFCYDPNC